MLKTPAGEHKGEVSKITKLILYPVGDIDYCPDSFLKYIKSATYDLF